MNRKTLPAASRNNGFSLIEVLITMIIVLVGLLSIAALQAKAQIAEFESYQRAQGLIIMSDIIDRMNLNRETLSCFQITTNTSTGTPYMGATGASHIAAPACGASTTEYNTMANNTITALDNLLKGAAETNPDDNNVGAMLGARACISYDNTTELGGQPGTGLYTIVVTWQALAALAAPTVNCANGLYGNENMRRAVSTRIRFADLY
jgi:type IV pilus assembly protein PilV